MCFRTLISCMHCCYMPNQHITRLYSVQIQPLQWPLSLNWREGKDIPTNNMLMGACSVVIDGMVYCGGNNMDSNVVVQYNPDNDDWNELPKPPVSGFALASLNNKLILAGGRNCDARITMWDSKAKKWRQRFPPMPTGRSHSAAVGYRNYLIVACGSYRTNEVEVLDSDSGRWYCAQPVPVGGHIMSSVVVGDRWYVSSFGGWEDLDKHIFWAHLPTLTSNAFSSFRITTERIWHFSSSCRVHFINPPGTLVIDWWKEICTRNVSL